MYSAGIGGTIGMESSTFALTPAGIKPESPTASTCSGTGAHGVPLIESGTEGYLGQARAIIRGRFKCYECDPPRKTESYPICTIRNHPDKPVHCIAWAKAQHTCNLPAVYLGLQPAHTWSQPPLHTVAAFNTCGCRSYSSRSSSAVRRPTW